MTDDLRTRLTDLIYGTVSWRDVNFPVAEEVADAVIRELRLTRQVSRDTLMGDTHDYHRYVTEWTTE